MDPVKVYSRIIHEDIELPASKLRDLVMACLDTLGIRDVQGKRGHPSIGHFREDFGPPGCRDDMQA